MAEKPESIKVLGQELDLTVKTNGEAVVSMKKADFDEAASPRPFPSKRVP